MLLGKAVCVLGHAGIEIVFPDSWRQLNTVVLRAGAEVNHFSELRLVAREIEEHAAIAIEQIRRSSQSPIRAGGGGMNDDVATMRAEVVAHRLPLRRSSSAEEGANTSYLEVSCSSRLRPMNPDPPVIRRPRHAEDLRRPRATNDYPAQRGSVKAGFSRSTHQTNRHRRGRL